jgi:hypothetical protein
MKPFARILYPAAVCAAVILPVAAHANSTATGDFHSISRAIARGQTTRDMAASRQIVKSRTWGSGTYYGHDRTAVMDIGTRAIPSIEVLHPSSGLRHVYTRQPDGTITKSEFGPGSAQRSTGSTTLGSMLDPRRPGIHGVNHGFGEGPLSGQTSVGGWHYRSTGSHGGAVGGEGGAYQWSK